VNIACAPLIIESCGFGPAIVVGTEEAGLHCWLGYVALYPNLTTVTLERDLDASYYIIAYIVKIV